MVHDEERLLLALVWETGKVVSDEQQHVYFRLLQKERKEGGEEVVQSQCHKVSKIMGNSNTFLNKKVLL